MDKSLTELAAQSCSLQEYKRRWKVQQHNFSVCLLSLLDTAKSIHLSGPFFFSLFMHCQGKLLHELHSELDRSLKGPWNIFLLLRSQLISWWPEFCIYYNWGALKNGSNQCLSGDSASRLCNDSTILKGHQFNHVESRLRLLLWSSVHRVHTLRASQI